MSRVTGMVPVAVAVVLSALNQPSLAGDDRDAPFGVFGSERILWVAEQRRTADDNNILFLVYRHAQGKVRHTYYPQMVIPLRGGVGIATVRGSALHVFSEDGAHMRYEPTGGSLGLRVLDRFREVNLPGSAVPQALCADDALGALFAVVSTSDAIRFAPAVLEETPADASSDNDEGAVMDALSPKHDTTFSKPPVAKSPVAKSPAPKSLTPNPATPCAIVRYAHGRWAIDRPAPEDVTPHTPILGLWSRNAVVHLVYGEVGSGAGIPRDSGWTHRFSTAADASWQEGGSVPKGLSAMASGWALDDPLLVYAEGSGDGAAAGVLRFDGERWSPHAVLLTSDETPLHLTEPTSSTLCGDEVCVAWRDADGEVVVGRWSAADGHEVEPATVVAPLVRSAVPPRFGSIRQWIEYTVLAMVLVVVFVWRRHGIVQTPTLPEGQILARAATRGLGFVIDALFVLAVCGGMLAAFLLSRGSELSWSEQIDRASPYLPQWSVAIYGCVYGVYGAAFEMRRGVTPGKRIAGIRVVMEDATPPTVAAVLVRNAARVVECYFPPLVLLLGVTAGHQRLGDLLARTLVIEQADPPEADGNRESPD